MSDLRDLEELLASIPKRDVAPNVMDATASLVEAGKVRGELALERTKVAQLSAMLDAARDTIAKANARITTLQIEVAEATTKLPPAREAPLPPDRSLEQVRAAERARDVATARTAELQVRLERAEERAKTAEAAIGHANMHAATAEAQVKDALERADKAYTKGHQDALNEVTGGRLIAEQEAIERKNAEIARHEVS
jgi:chromosome segregation ATPase